jgi:LEA14-like dessication related protein
MNKHLIVIFLITLSLSSCKRYEEIEIKKITAVEFKGFENNRVNLDINMLIDNPSIHNINLQKIDVKVYLNNKYIGKMQNTEELKIKRRSTDNYTLSTELRIGNIFTGLTSVMALKNNPNAKIRMEGTVDIRSAIWKRSFEISEEQSLN